VNFDFDLEGSRENESRSGIMIFLLRMTKEGLEICRRGDLGKRGSSEGSKQNISRLSDDVAESWKPSINGAKRSYIVEILEIPLMDPLELDK
jgi:hypothetical protein